MLSIGAAAAAAAASGPRIYALEQMSSMSCCCVYVSAEQLCDYINKIKALKGVFVSRCVHRVVRSLRDDRDDNGNTVLLLTNSVLKK